jgi:hypothetical protein
MLKNGKATRMKRIAANARSLIALAAFAAIAAGFWLIHPGLGLIVPGGIVFGSLAWTHLRNPNA